MMTCYSNDIYQRIVSAKMFMDEHFDEDLSLDEIARHACLSKFHFLRIFKNIYKKTPHEYLTQTRLEQSKLLLAKEGISITDVCNLVGFESLGSFSNLFKKQSGYAPQYYRNIAYLKRKLAKQQPKRFIPNCYIETVLPLK